MASANFFELLGISSDTLADTIPERIVDAYHTGGKEAVRELVYVEVADKLRSPLHVRSTEHGGEAVYGGGHPGRPIYLVKDARDLFTRINEDGTPYAPRMDAGYGLAAPGVGAGLGGVGGGSGGGGGSAPRPRKPRPSGGAAGGGGQSARDKERDATWEAKYQNLLHFVRSHGHRPRRTGEDKERQMCFWLAQQQRKMKDGSLTDDKRHKLQVVLAVKGPAARGGGGGTPSGAGGGGGGSEYGDDDDGGDDEGEGEDGDAYDNDGGQDGGDQEGDQEDGEGEEEGEDGGSGGGDNGPAAAAVAAAAPVAEEEEAQEVGGGGGGGDVPAPAPEGGAAPAAAEDTPMAEGGSEMSPPSPYCTALML